MMDPVTSSLVDASSEAVLAVENLTVAAIARNASLIVQNISFDARAGETVCIVGESGSGKSVTALAIMGLLPKDSLAATQGRILLDGEDLLKASPERIRQRRATRMAMVFQEPMTALNPVQRVGLQVDEVLRLHTQLNATERRIRVLKMFERVRLPDIERIYDAYPHQLSGGQRQRIVIAMALILRPRLLIADEPTTALDVTTQKKILSLIRELQDEEQTAVVFITHDFGVVSEIADRIAVVNKGRLVETGTREQILAIPRDAYTRMLVSSVPGLIPRHDPITVGPAVLKVVSLDKRFEERRFFRSSRVVQAVRNVSFAVRRGEITGLIGESGSGKSTVARCIMRLTDPTSGTVMLDDQDLTKAADLGPVYRRAQYIFQDPYRSLNPRRAVGDSVIEGLVNVGMPRSKALAKAARTLELVGLSPDVMRGYPHQFSGGQRQRICIARALVMEPILLIADEAVSALDVSVQAQVLALFEDIRQRTGVAILFITHDLRVAAQICNAIVVMQCGKVVESGSAQAVLAQPQHPYTQALIQAAPAPDWDFQNFRPLAR